MTAFAPDVLMSPFVWRCLGICLLNPLVQEVYRRVSDLLGGGIRKHLERIARPIITTVISYTSILLDQEESFVAGCIMLVCC